MRQLPASVARPGHPRHCRRTRGVPEPATPEDHAMHAGQELAFLFDLDGTLVDSVYQHWVARHEVLRQAGIALSI